MKDSYLKEVIKNLNLDIAEKTQVNDNATDSVSDTYSASKIEELIAAIPAGGDVEGTAVLSTGETGGTKFLREDGDGTCSWQNGLALGELSTTAYRGDRGKTAYDHSQVAHAPSDADKTVTVIGEADAGEPSGSAEFPFVESGTLAVITLDSLKTLLKEYFDTLYTPL